MQPRSPVLSIRAVVFIVSPKSWKRDRSPRRTPPVTGPLCMPMRNFKSPVPGPSASSSTLVTVSIFLIISLAKRAITTA